MFPLVLFMTYSELVRYFLATKSKYVNNQTVQEGAKTERERKGEQQ